MSDAELLALGRREIDAIGLVSASEVIDGCVVRMPKAYPVYDDEYQAHLAVIRRWLAGLGNLELAGRNGMHKYNNQDHSMMTALLAARNILGLGRYDTWKVNTDAEYHEEGGEEGASTPRDAWYPQRLTRPEVRAAPRSGHRTLDSSVRLLELLQGCRLIGEDLE